MPILKSAVRKAASERMMEMTMKNERMSAKMGRTRERGRSGDEWGSANEFP